MKRALWLMDRFGVPQSISGDLLEAYNVGRSEWWLWRQATSAVVRAVAHQTSPASTNR